MSAGCSFSIVSLLSVSVMGLCPVCGANSVLVHCAFAVPCFVLVLALEAPIVRQQ